MLADSIEPEFYERTPGALRITPAGQLFVRNICMLFDRYLEEDGGQTGMYSKTV